MAKRILRVISLSLIVAVLMSTFVCALAAKKGTTESNVSFTVTTGKKDSVLKLTNSKGKLEYDKISFVGIPPKKKVARKTATVYAEYSIKITPNNGKGTMVTMKGSGTSIKLKANTTYTITVSYKGINGYNLYANWKWKNNPSWKVKSASNGAKVK